MSEESEAHGSSQNTPTDSQEVLGCICMSFVVLLPQVSVKSQGSGDGKKEFAEEVRGHYVGHIDLHPSQDKQEEGARKQ